MKKLILSLLTMSAVCFGAFAADDAEPKARTLDRMLADVLIHRTDHDTLFPAREFGAEVGYGGTVSDLGGRNDLSAGHGEARLSYWHTPNIGLLITGDIDHDGTRAFDGFGAGVRLGYPIGHFRPYVGALVSWTSYDVRNGGDYTSYNAIGGIQVRVTERLTLFGEARKDVDRWRGDDLEVLVGVGLSL